MTSNTIAALLSRATNHLERLADHGRGKIDPIESPSESWHSWDPTPWAHPWLTHENLSKAKAFDGRLLSNIGKNHGGVPARAGRYAFVGNLANNMAMRALPLRQRGYSVDIFLHPQDRSVMSQPGWELSEAMLPNNETNVDLLRANGICLPEVSGVFTPPIISGDELARLITRAKNTRSLFWRMLASPRFMRQNDIRTWGSYFAYLHFFEALQSYRCIFAAQAPYLAYFANRPYLAAQTGGDLWLECSRNDAFGILQRKSYRNASAILATNPWAYSNARRFGFRHVIYVPLMVDTEAYAPGPSASREAWKKQVGGEFFALVTARIDRRWKGSHIGIEGFARFALRNPQARLVLVGWGEDSSSDIDALKALGLDGRFIQLPVSGKRKLVEYLRAADCLIDQFVIGYYGATALEAMATGVPVIMRLLAEQYDALCPTGAPPVLNASTPDEVAACLERLAVSHEARQDLALASRRWIELNHSVDKWGEHYGALLNAAATGMRFDFQESPLATPLSRAELAYHAASLAAAPTFPNYDI